MKLKSTGLKFKNLGNPPTTIQTPDNHISLPTQVLAVGSVGRGKTFWLPRNPKLRNQKLRNASPSLRKA